jgi:hypothetical protein
MPTLDVDSKLEPAAILEAAERLRPPPLQDGDVALLSTPPPRPPISLVWGWRSAVARYHLDPWANHDLLRSSAGV